MSPPATEEIGAMGLEIESRQGIHRVVILISSTRLKLVITRVSKLFLLAGTHCLQVLNAFLRK
jgi:hypothetical protein